MAANIELYQTRHRLFYGTTDLKQMALPTDTSIGLLEQDIREAAHTRSIPHFTSRPLPRWDPLLQKLQQGLQVETALSFQEAKKMWESEQAFLESQAERTFDERKRTLAKKREEFLKFRNQQSIQTIKREIQALQSQYSEKAFPIKLKLETLNLPQGKKKSLQDQLIALQEEKREKIRALIKREDKEKEKMNVLSSLLYGLQNNLESFRLRAAQETALQQREEQLIQDWKNQTKERSKSLQDKMSALSLPETSLPSLSNRSQYSPTAHAEKLKEKVRLWKGRTEHYPHQLVAQYAKAHQLQLVFGNPLYSRNGVPISLDYRAFWDRP